MSSALSKYRVKDLAGYVAELEVLARRGDPRAQYLLGVAFLQGEGTERNIAQGLAWLQVAAQPYEGQFALDGAADAKEALRQVMPQVSGADMLRADQITAQFVDSVRRDIEAGMARAERAMLEAVQGQASPLAADGRIDVPVAGCALDLTLSDCPTPRPAKDGTPRCQGDWAVADAKATDPTLADLVLRKSYPPEARRRGYEGATMVAVHVDRGGDVCQAMLVRTSGFSMLDKASLRAAQRLRYKPAMREGLPVESFRHFTFTHRLVDHGAPPLPTAGDAPNTPPTPH